MSTPQKRHLRQTELGSSKTLEQLHEFSNDSEIFVLDTIKDGMGEDVAMVSFEKRDVPWSTYITSWAYEEEYNVTT